MRTSQHGGEIAGLVSSHLRMEGSGGQDLVLLSDNNWGQDIEDLSLNTGLTLTVAHQLVGSRNKETLSISWIWGNNEMVTQF